VQGVSVTVLTVKRAWSMMQGCGMRDLWLSVGWQVPPAQWGVYVAGLW
jgi:hypothetical protein